MKHLSKSLAFATGCLTMAILGWLTTVVRAQTGYENAIHVCVAEDGALRLTPGSCPLGQRSLYLKKAGEEADEPEEPDDDPADEQKLAELERRIAQLENKSTERQNGSSTVVAPFEVVDKGGRRIFSVEEGVVKVYNGGQAVALIRATESGGQFTALSTTGDLQASIGASAGRSGVILSESGVERIYMGKQESGHYGAKFSARSGNYVAAVGQSTVGLGLVGVYAPDGSPRALMRATSDGQGGHISISNGTVAVAEMTIGKTGGGLLTIGSSSGERMVAAGVQPGGFGVVQTGPAAFAAVAGLPLPASYISGKP